MKKIKNLTVRMTFRAGLGDVTVSDSVYRGLDKIADKGEIDDNEANRSKDKDIIEAWEWLGSNINSGDALSWEYEIEDLIEE